MSGLLRRFVELLRPARLDRETADELSHHIDLVVARKMATGIDESTARREARLEVGSVALVREQISEQRTGFALEQCAREVRHAARVLRRSPGVTVLSILTLGVGIGASALLFALVDHILLRPLPYPDSGRLVRIFDTNAQANLYRAGAAIRNIDDWRRRTPAFDAIAGYYVMGRTASFDVDADVLITAQVTQDFFAVAGVKPLLGHVFSEEETTRASFDVANAPTGADPVVILSHAVWVQRFGRDANVVGRALLLERRRFQIVGVMPDQFALPDAGVQVWIPWRVAPDDPRDQHYLGAIGRLKPNMSLSRAEDRLNATARELASDYPTTNRGWGVRLSPLVNEIVGDASSTLWLLLGAVGVVLFVAAANVGLLSLIRGLDRREDTAVRLALGANAGRLVREYVWESALLALVGSVLGLVIAVTGLRIVPAVTPDLPRLQEAAFDGRAVLFILAVAGFAGLVAGLPQAWRHIRMSPRVGLSSGTLRTTEGIDAHRFRDSVVVIQIALATVLMIGSGLLTRSFLELRTADPGFDARRVLVVPIFLDTQAYSTGAKVRTYYRTLFGRLSALPGVVAVAGATTVPTSPLGPDFDRPVWPAGTTPDVAARTPASVRIVTSGYVDAMGLRLVAGRAIDDRDSPQAPRAMMVSESLARRMWPDRSAVGQQLVVDYSTAGVYPYEVVGVVRDVKFRGPRSQPALEIYLAHAQRSYLILNVVVKTAGDPRALIAPVRSTLKSVDPQKPAQGLYPLEDLMGATYARDRQVMVVLLAFASTVGFLALLAMYGALSQRVRERSREIGIRVAMGAHPWTVVGWIAASGGRLFAIGLASGIVATRMASGALNGLLYGVAPMDPAAIVSAVLVLGMIGALATLIPAWRASLVDPVRVLRRG